MRLKAIILAICLSCKLLAQQNPAMDQKISPFNDAALLWNFADLKEASGKYNALNIIGAGFTLGKISSENSDSPARNSDGLAGIFNGKGWLSLNGSERLDIPGKESFTFSIRVKAEKSGGLMRTNLCSLFLHESGFVIALIPVKDNLGRYYREFPLGQIQFNEWHNLVVRYNKGSLQFIADGLLSNEIILTEHLQAIDSDPILLGTWRMDEPPNAGLPKHASDWLYERPLIGQIDYVAIWNRYLNNDEVAFLSNVLKLKTPQKATDAQLAMKDYLDFSSASRKKDTINVEKLGLSMRKFMARDPKRSVYHLTAPSDGLFDPAGAFFHNGLYHVFSYRNMTSLLANTPLMHYTSKDLIHWKDMPIAIWADSDMDVKGIWLGNIFYNDEKKPVMIYTALGKQGKIGVLAESHDNLLSFTDKKPVIKSLVHHDGHTWKDGNTWYSITVRQYWGRSNGLGDGIVLLSSTDLLNWKECGDIFNVPPHPKPADDNQKDGLAEFPYLLPFGDKHVLMMGTRPVRYWIGKFDKNKPSFIPDESQGKLLDFLNNFYCFNPSITDLKGKGGAERRIVLGMNINTMGRVDGIPWFGAHVLPRVVTRDGTRLIQQPVPEVEMLRGKHYHKNKTLVSAGASNFLNDITGDALEIIAEFTPGTSSRFGLKVRGSKDGKTATKVYVDVKTGQIGAEGNLKISSPYPEIGQTFAYLKTGQPVKIRLFLDHSLLEVFVNGQAGSAVFNSDPSATGLDLFSEGGDAILNSLDIWVMNPIWTLPE